MSRSRCVDGDRGQNPNNCSGASRTSPLLLTAPLAGPLPGPGRPEHGRHPDSSASRPESLYESLDSLRGRVFLRRLIRALRHLPRGFESPEAGFSVGEPLCEF
ncbi:hypothetical protein NDU88_003283 [Pleurodeles waltl]|uniref:Uncharacterized protein n=1 Tax=Pleurodeles waltl TaxID=8319 RepID=A0AAV7VHF4_PLEWA|nr:hypothetical protein NDU88_003283 [Pleurodeles waltl]